MNRLFFLSVLIVITSSMKNEFGFENIISETDPIFSPGPYEVKVTEVSSGDSGAPRQFKIYEPTGASGKVPVVHFLHGFQLKYNYYDNLLNHLSSHGFIVVSGQSTHSLIGGDTTYKEAEKVVTFINWLKENLSSKISVTIESLTQIQPLQKVSFVLILLIQHHHWMVVQILQVLMIQFNLKVNQCLLVQKKVQVDCPPVLLKVKTV